MGKTRTYLDIRHGLQVGLFFHSFNNPKDGETVFYGRDRGEKGNMTRTYKNREEFGRRFGEEFGYVWSMKERKWYYFDSRGRQKEL